jgi:hypothetical protein
MCKHYTRKIYLVCTVLYYDKDIIPIQTRSNLRKLGSNVVLGSLNRSLGTRLLVVGIVDKLERGLTPNSHAGGLDDSLLKLEGCKKR